MHLSWADVSNEATYLVERSTDNATWSVSGGTLGPQQSQQVTAFLTAAANALTTSSLVTALEFRSAGTLVASTSTRGGRPAVTRQLPKRL